MQEQKNIILEKSFDFSLLVIEYAELLESRKKYVVANQLLKSGTSIGANVHEAQNAESKLDFIHKIKVAAKEAEETEYWLMLCKHSKSYPDCDYLLHSLKEIQRLLNSIIETTQLQINK